jgi:hypothetical protein
MASFAATLLAGLSLAGCGTASSDPAANVPKIKVTSRAIQGLALPARYTCDGTNTPPPLEWGAVPARTASLVLIVLAIVPKPNSTAFSFSVAWSVAGINPQLHKLSPGRLPRGAFVGYSSDGKRNYGICPPKGTAEQYQFELYGLPRGDTVARQFAGLSILAGLSTSSKSSPTDAYGALVTTYRRS